MCFCFFLVWLPMFSHAYPQLLRPPTPCERPQPERRWHAHRWPQWPGRNWWLIRFRRGDCVYYSIYIYNYVYVYRYGDKNKWRMCTWCRWRWYEEIEPGNAESTTKRSINKQLSHQKPIPPPRTTSLAWQTWIKPHIKQPYLKFIFVVVFAHAQGTAPWNMLVFVDGIINDPYVFAHFHLSSQVKSCHAWGGVWAVAGGEGVMGGGVITFLALAHMFHATLWHLLLHLQPGVMLRYDIFSCTCTQVSCYAMTSSLALAARCHATLWGVAGRNNVPCACKHVSCYAMTSSLALANMFHVSCSV